MEIEIERLEEGSAILRIAQVRVKFEGEWDECGLR